MQIFVLNAIEISVPAELIWGPLTSHADILTLEPALGSTGRQWGLSCYIDKSLSAIPPKSRDGFELRGGSWERLLTPNAGDRQSRANGTFGMPT
jgi:hypothetical protein